MDTMAVLCAILACAINYNTLDSGFVYDDSRAILTNPDIVLTTPLSSIWKNDFWGTPINSSNSHGSYRPLCVLSFRLNYWFSGLKPWYYHAVNVLLHSISTYLIYVLGKLILPYSTHITAAIIFAVHPIHTEAVASIVGRAELLANIFFVLSFLCYIHHVKHRNRWQITSDDNRSNFIAFGKRCPQNQLNGCVVVSNQKYKICCDAEYHFKTYRLGFLISKIFGVLKLGTCSSELEGLPSNMSECSAVREWLCLFASVILAAASMLSKETGITVIAICMVYDFIKTKPNTPSKRFRLYRSLIILGCAMCSFLLFRLYIMGNSVPSFATSDNPTSKSKSTLTRTLTFLYLPIFNFGLLLYPLYLSFDWGMDAIPRVTSIYDRRNIITLVFYSLMYTFTKNLLWEHIHTLDKHYKEHRNFHYSRKYRYRNKSTWSHTSVCRKINNNNIGCNNCKCQISDSDERDLVDTSEASIRIKESCMISLSILVLSFIPATNLFFYVGFVVAERVLYIPSIGYCFFVAVAFDALEKRTNFKVLLRLLLTFLVFVLSIRTILRNWDWSNDESLYRSGISVNPPKAYANLGSVLSSHGRIEEAEYALRTALNYRPNMADAHYNLGILQQRKTQYEEAINSYKLAIHYRPSLALAHLNLGQLLVSQGRCEEAEQILRRCIKLDGRGLKDRRTHESTKISALMHLGRLQADRGKYKEAVSIYKEAVQSLPEYHQPQILYNLLGESLSHLGQHEEAEMWHMAAIQAKPDHIPAHLIYGKLLAKNKTRICEAEQLFLRAQKLAPNDPAVYLHYGHFLSDIQRYSEASHQFLEAVRLAPNEYEPIMNAATAFRQSGRYLQAEQMYRKAASLRPDDSSAHINLGAMLHMNEKYTEAILSYQRALKINPHDTIALANRNKLKIVLKQLKP